MQGRADEPLNGTGLMQAKNAREKLISQYPGLSFDAVYSSPLKRAVVTGSVIGNIPEEKVITDKRLIEADFGKYDLKKYWLLGPRMSLYWAMPEIFPAPSSVETTGEMIQRIRSFLDDLKKTPYDNVLIACHGGIMRVLSGCLEGRPRGYIWRPKPHNCEIRMYEI